MKFRKFSSIENHYRQRYINYILEKGFGTGEWVKTLKIHGSNYSYSCDGNEVKKGKRTSFLDEGFFGDHHFDYSSNVKTLFKYLNLKGYNVKVVTVYGEIFGGVYNHPDVPKVAGYTRIQKEVQYCPENRFAAFDVVLDGVPMNWDDVKEYCNLCSIPIVPELGRGTFEDLLLSDTIFPDPLHAQFGLPPIDGNDAEGWVLKPLEEKTFDNGERVIVKGKNPNFNEKNRVKKTPKITKLTDAGNEIKDIIFSYITENRLRNVISHGPVIKQKDFGKLLGLFAQDVFNDFRKDYQKEFEVLDLDEQAIIKKLMNTEAGNVIRPNFMNIIDGEF